MTTFRDVVLRTRIEVVNDDPFKKTATATDRTEKAFVRMRSEVKRLTGEVHRLQQAEKQRGDAIRRAVDEAIRKERELLKARKDTANASRPGALEGVGGVAAGFAGAFGAATGGIGGALAVAAVTINTPKVVLPAAAEAIKGIAAELSGIFGNGQGDPFKNGLFTAPGNEFWKAIGVDFSEANGHRLVRGGGFFGGAGLNRPEFAAGHPANDIVSLLFDRFEEVRPVGVGDGGGRSLLQQDEDRVATGDRLLSQIAQQRALLQRLHQDDIEAQQERVRLSKQQIQIEKQKLTAIERELAVFDKDRQSFASLNRDERQQAFAIAGKIGRRGFGALSEREVEFARSSGVFGASIESQSKRPELQKEFRRLLGLSGEGERESGLRLRRRQAQDEIRVQQEIAANVKVGFDDEGLDRLEEQVRELVRAAVKDLAESLGRRTRTELERERVRASGGPDF